MRTIPRAPARLRLPVERLWDGAPCDAGIRAAVELSLVGDALELRGELLQPGPPRTPDAPPGVRVPRLFEFDVVECFLAGAGGRYLELELGQGGRYLALSFRARRQLSNAHERLRPRVEAGRCPGGWWASLRVPGALLPAGIRAVGAFAHAGGLLLAHHPVPGPEPDFHQPDLWPAARLAGGPG
jgi:hypothetical protein